MPMSAIRIKGTLIIIKAREGLSFSRASASLAMRPAASISVPQSSGALAACVSNFAQAGFRAEKGLQRAGDAHIAGHRAASDQARFPLPRSRTT